MTTQATIQKRQDLATFIRHELAAEPAVQAVIGIGSIASGLARPDSDIDAIVFLDPFDWYIVPAEFRWCPSDGSFHSIFGQLPGLDECIQFDFVRCDLAQWAAPSYDWPEGRRVALRQGWTAFDRTGHVTELIAERTAYTRDVRMARLDEAITWLDQHLSGDGPKRRWSDLGPVIAHDRLLAAYHYLVQAMFAYNSRWRPWRNRMMTTLLALPWLPEGFADRVLILMNPPVSGYNGYLTQVEVLRGMFHSVISRLVADSDYGDDVIGEAFTRSHEEPGRAWNMDEWNIKHQKRTA